MSLDATTDPLVAALLLIGKDKTNEALSDALDENAVVGAYGFPITLELLTQVALPSLSIHRLRTTASVTGRLTDWRTVFRFEYVSRSTPLQKVGLRWPLLFNVQVAMLNAVCRGVHGEDDDQILTAAGVIEVEADDVEIRETFIVEAGAGAAYPMFRMDLPIRWRPAVVVDLPDAVDLLANQILAGKPEEGQPHVASLHVLEDE